MPRAYRSLLRAYPAAWRAANGEAVLSTLRELRESRGRTGPTVGDHVHFLLDGLRHRLPGAPAVRTTAPIRLLGDAPWRPFDQLNAVVDVTDHAIPSPTRAELLRRRQESSEQAMAILWSSRY